MIRNWISMDKNKLSLNEEQEQGPATCRGNFIGQDNSDLAASGEVIYTDINNLPTALASILNHAQNRSDFHPATQPPDHLAGRLASYITEISKIPFFQSQFHDVVERNYDHGNVNVLIADILKLYVNFSQKERDDMAIALAELGKSVFGAENAAAFLNLFAVITINASDPNNVDLLIYYACFEMHKFKKGKDSVSRQRFKVWRHGYKVSHTEIKAHAKELAELTKMSVDQWITGVTSKEDSRQQFCFSIEKIRELITVDVDEVPVLRGLKLPYPFVLSGKIHEPWSKVSNNQWNKMLSKHWIDKGFHFYQRIRLRGAEAGIHTPSDLESAIRSGTVFHVLNDRYRIVLPIVNSQGQHFTVFYDYNKSKSLCELVTCSYA